MKTAKQKLQKETDRLLQETVRKLNPHCIVCGKPEQVGHHHHPKSVSNRLRYELKNIVPLCHGCHMRHHQAHDPTIQEKYTERMGGEKWKEELQAMRKEPVKVDKIYYLNAIGKFEELNK